MLHGARSSRGLAILLVAMLLISSLTACGQTEANNNDSDIKPNPIASPSRPEVPAFYRNLSGLLSNEKNSHYFGKIELSVGSNVMTVDGEEQVTANTPEYNEGRLMLPVTAIAETAGAKVKGNVTSASGLTIQSAYGDIISCSSNSATLSINGSESLMDVTPYSKGKEAYMSVNSLASALELEWTWNQETSTVTLTAPYQNARILVMAGDDLDVSGLEAETALNDGSGIWILQFKSPSQAKAALKMLSVKGYQAKPDFYLALDSKKSVDDLNFDTSTHSWGVVDCGFNEFIDDYKAQFSGNVVVGVVDTGIYTQHPFMNGRVLNGFDIIEGDFDPQDNISHGTHVGGTIIDCCRNAPVQILPVRVFDDNGDGSDSTIIEGIKYAVDSGADVINLSLGGPRWDEVCAIESSAIQYAVEKGCVVVISAGNEDMDTEEIDPAYVTMPGTIVVSAGDERHNKADFSNYGESVDLMAPGVSITSCVPGDEEFEAKSGTSMAAPHASAAVALLDLATGKSLSPAELEQTLHSATTNGKWTDAESGYGFLDMRKANIPESKNEPSPVAGAVLMADYIEASSKEEAENASVFGSEVKRNQISTITFLSNINSNRKDAWDVSENQNKSVMAWTVENGELYDLYIAAENGVIAPANCGKMFYGYSNLRRIDFNDAFDTAYTTNMGYMFARCGSLTDLDLSGFVTSHVTDMSDMFWLCKSLTILNIDSFDTKQVTTMHLMFCNCNVRELNVSNFNTSHVKNMNAMFDGCDNLRKLDISNFDTSNVIAMGFMFNECKNLSDLDIRNINTSQVTDMKGMFQNCEKIETLDVSSFDTSNVTSMAWMFNGCKALGKLDVSGFDTSQVTDMNCMFQNCESLQTLDVSHFNTSKVTRMSWMFNACKNVSALDVSGFNTSKVKTMETMFATCEMLEYLDVSGFDMSNVTNTNTMFVNCPKLESVAFTSPVMLGKYMFAADVSLAEVTFTNSALGAEESVFAGCNTTVYYPDDDASWTEIVENSFGGNVEWIAQ